MGRIDSVSHTQAYKIIQLSGETCKAISGETRQQRHSSGEPRYPVTEVRTPVAIAIWGKVMLVDLVLLLRGMVRVCFVH